MVHGERFINKNRNGPDYVRCSAARLLIPSSLSSVRLVPCMLSLVLFIQTD